MSPWRPTRRRRPGTGMCVPCYTSHYLGAFFYSLFSVVLGTLGRDQVYYLLYHWGSSKAGCGNSNHRILKPSFPYLGDGVRMMMVSVVIAEVEEETVTAKGAAWIMTVEGDHHEMMVSALLCWGYLSSLCGGNHTFSCSRKHVTIYSHCEPYNSSYANIV